MKTIAIINYKGGVCKTTITSNLAVDLANRGKRILAIDLDPQTNLTLSFMKADEWQDNYKDKTIKNLFDAIISNKNVLPTLDKLTIQRLGIDIISFHLALIDLDTELAAGIASSTAIQFKNNFIKTYSYLKNALNQVKDYYDVVLFDCPPNFSTITRNAIVASDYYAIPARMDYLSTLGINQLINHINDLTREYNSYANSKIQPQFLGVIATMIGVKDSNPWATNQAYIHQLHHNNIAMFRTMLRESKTFYSKAAKEGIPAVCLKTDNQTQREVVHELKALTDEFIGKVGI